MDPLMDPIDPMDPMDVLTKNHFHLIGSSIKWIQWFHLNGSIGFQWIPMVPLDGSIFSSIGSNGFQWTLKK